MNFKNRKFFIVVVAVILLFNFSSCSKYEDGPVMSLRTKKARLTGEWELQEIDGNKYIYDAIWEFEGDGDFEYNYEEGDVILKGEWTWEEGKEIIEIDYDDAGKVEMEILRLTNTELILENESGDEYEFEKE